MAESATKAAESCTTDGTCVTCGDVAVPVRILGPGSEPGLASGADGSGTHCEVEVDLVGPVSPGDVVLVHAGVALTRMDGEDTPLERRDRSAPGERASGEEVATWA